MQKLLRVGRIGVVLGLLPMLSRCGGSDLVLPSETVAAAITKADGDGQTAVVGVALADSIVAKVLDQRGDPMPGVRVAFAPGTGADGAVLRPEVATTNSEGLAKAQWVLGTTGGAQSVIASVADSAGLEVTFQASAHPGDPHRIEQGGGDQQGGKVGDVLADPLVVLVKDEFGNPVEDVAVAWSTGDGSVDPASSTTGADGKASTSWRLGSSPGAQSAAATVEGLNGSPVTFTATAGPGGASRLVLVSGNNQTGNPGQELSQPVVVRLEDAAGNGVSGRPVSWVIGSGGGDVNANTSSTDADGEAQVRWTLGPNPGINTLNAVVSGVGFVTFRAIATGGGGGNGGGGNGGGGNGGDGGSNGGGGGSSPVRLHFVVQPSDADHGKKITPAVQVEVLDQAGGRVTQQDFEITLELLGDNGKLQGHNREKTRSGVATFADIKVDKEGQYRLRAAADGLPSLDSDAFEIHDDHGQHDDHGHHEHGGHGRD